MTDYAKDVLVDTQWVENHLDDASIRIVEVDENPALYAEAHIPGAIGFDWKKDLQDQVRRDFLGPKEFGELMGSRGIGNEHQVVLYGDRNNWFAAYTYWYFSYYGHDNLRLMNGPREKWISEGRPTSSDAPSYEAQTFQVGRRRRLDPCQARRGARRARLGHAAGGRPLAAGVLGRADLDGGLRAGGRPARRATSRARRRCHGPRPSQEDGTFKSADELRELYEGKGVIDGQPIIAYCRIGERSAHTWFVLHELLGQGDVKNYDGSWTEWGNLVDVPIERDV